MYTIFRNLGYVARGANVILDALDNLGGNPLSDEQKRARARQQDEKLSVVAFPNPRPPFHAHVYKPQGLRRIYFRSDVVSRRRVNVVPDRQTFLRVEFWYIES